MASQEPPPPFNSNDQLLEAGPALKRTSTAGGVERDATLRPSYLEHTQSSSSVLSFVDAPPTYTKLDDRATSFTFEPPLIHASTATSKTPRYQISISYSQSGKPTGLNIRRLMPSESRRLSVSKPSETPSTPTVAITPTTSNISPARPQTPRRSSLSLLSRLRSNSLTSAPSPPASPTSPDARPQGSKVPTFPFQPSSYDDAATMYSISVLPSASVSLSLQNLEMRGHRATCVRGQLRPDPCGSYSADKHVFRRWTKDPQNDMLREENERRMLKYGYHADEEWTKEVWLERVRKEGVRGEWWWVDRNGHRVAEERGGRGKENGEGVGGVLTVLREGDASMRDLLVTCWVVRCWMTGGGGKDWL